jgi:hypothetical protein
VSRGAAFRRRLEALEQHAMAPARRAALARELAASLRAMDRASALDDWTDARFDAEVVAFEDVLARRAHLGLVA